MPEYVPGPQGAQAVLGEGLNVPAVQLVHAAASEADPVVPFETVPAGHEMQLI